MNEEENILDEREERRMEWENILRDCLRYHTQVAIDLKSPIIGAEESQECIMHQVWAHAIRDAVNLIEILPLINEDNERNGENGLPQHRQGPLG